MIMVLYVHFNGQTKIILSQKFFGKTFFGHENFRNFFQEIQPADPPTIPAREKIAGTIRSQQAAILGRSPG